MIPTRYLILTAIVATGLAMHAPLRAEDNGGNDNERGGQVNGEEALEQEIVLTATADAPAGTKGKAELKATNVNGVASAILKLEIEGLAPGTYTVTSTSLADGTTTTVLGTFDVTAPSTGGTGGDDNTGDDHQGGTTGGSTTGGTDANNQGTEDHAAAVSGVIKREHGGSNNGGDDGEAEVVFGTADGIAFPTGFNPLDIGAVTISDANSVVLLNGSFAAASSTTFTAAVQVTGAAADPTASGTAVVKARVKNNRLTQRFALAAKGLPGNANVTVSFNGAQTVKAHTSKKGTLGLTHLPTGVAGHRLTSVDINDETGTKLAGAHF
jgi:hypothetical protein